MSEHDASSQTIPSPAVVSLAEKWHPLDALAIVGMAMFVFGLALRFIPVTQTMGIFPFIMGRLDGGQWTPGSHERRLLAKYLKWRIAASRWLTSVNGIRSRSMSKMVDVRIESHD